MLLRWHILRSNSFTLLEITFHYLAKSIFLGGLRMIGEHNQITPKITCHTTSVQKCIPTLFSLVFSTMIVLDDLICSILWSR